MNAVKDRVNGIREVAPGATPGAAAAASATGGSGDWDAGRWTAGPEVEWAAVSASVPAGARLTIGVIARNGLPFLRACLASLPPEGTFAGELAIVLVDSDSSDGTTETMTAFAAARRDARVYRIEGSVNAAAARNVVLEHAPAGFLMLLDGDMVLNPAFVAAAVGRIRNGEADAVVGALREQHFDADNRPDGEEVWRHPPGGPALVRLAGGAILLGPPAREMALRYDEGQRICEDWDFALRLSRRRRLLRVPDCMALHLTHHYFSPQRRLDFYRDMRPRALGRMVRKHLGSPAGLLAVVNRERGVFMGGALQWLALLALAAGQPLLAVGALALFGADAARNLLRGKGQQWAGTRLFAPWLVLAGLLVPPRPSVRYDIRQIGGRPAPAPV
ncbi:glycosyltransferase family 2 protein [Azospirillum halopraeferens]|uniref:glycosyltransferase family 2 protein n=1 Tax=Azospirillum halopraeferens TaxID=34010 RepID=UPI00048EBE9B|nr:glycosyltransferase family A protein [Azospirillum halopraeferens]